MNLVILLLYLAVLSLPGNVFFVVRWPAAYLNGHFIDYLAPKLYLSQLLIWLLWLASVLLTRGKTHKTPIFASLQKLMSSKLAKLALFLLLVMIGQSFWRQDWAMLSWWFNLITGPIFFGLWVWRHRSLIHRHFWKAIILSTSWQSLLGIQQYIRQESLLPYWAGGEPLFSPQANLATSAWKTEHWLLPYGGSPHPNILAGWLVIGIIAGFIYWYIHKRHYVWLVIAVGWQALCLWWTESITAYLSLLIFFWLWLWLLLNRRPIFGFFSTKRHRLYLIGAVFLSQLFWLTWPQMLSLINTEWLNHASIYSQKSVADMSEIQLSIWRRGHLLQESILNFLAKPWGISLKDYFQTVWLAETDYLGGRFLQPVHHSGLLALTIYGLWVIFLFLIILYIVQKKYSIVFLIWLAIAPIFNLDHYLLSLISGQYQLIIYLLIFMTITNQKYHNKSLNRILSNKQLTSQKHH